MPPVFHSRGCYTFCMAIKLKSSFLYDLPATFNYPFRGRGRILLLAGAMTFWGLILLADLSFVALIPVLFGGCYLSAYMVRAISASAAGEYMPPDWPEFTNWWDDMLRPMLLVLATVLVGFGPALIWGIISLARWGSLGAGFYLLLIPGAVYLPMGLLAVAMYDTVDALNPVTVAAAIVRTSPHYLIACGMMAGVLGLGFAGALVLTAIPWVGSLLAIAMMLYLLLVVANLMGLIYTSFEKELDWFTMP